MKRFADLHVHTNHSDGILSPSEVIDNAIGAGLSVLAIADHDTLTGYLVSRDYAASRELILVSAVELSTSQDGTELHILGYLVDSSNQMFLDRISDFQRERSLRGEKIVEKLNELGIDLSLETVKRLAGDSVLGRPHVADALVQEEYVRSFDEAFARYLGYHAPAYVPKAQLTPEQAISLIHEAGGVAVIAHPGTVAKDDLILELADEGLDGIEAIYPLHDHRTMKKYIRMAEELGLIYTGGSDNHGRATDRAPIGGITVPQECYEGLLQAKDKYVTKEQS